MPLAFSSFVVQPNNVAQVKCCSCALRLCPITSKNLLTESIGAVIRTTYLLALGFWQTNTWEDSFEEGLADFVYLFRRLH